MAPHHTRTRTLDSLAFQKTSLCGFLAIRLSLMRCDAVMIPRKKEKTPSFPLRHRGSMQQQLQRPSSFSRVFVFFPVSARTTVELRSCEGRSHPIPFPLYRAAVHHSKRFQQNASTKSRGLSRRERRRFIVLYHPLAKNVEL